MISIYVLWYLQREKSEQVGDKIKIVLELSDGTDQDAVAIPQSRVHLHNLIWLAFDVEIERLDDSRLALE